MTVTTIIIIFFAFAAGGVVSWFYAKQKQQSISANLEFELNQVKSTNTRLEQEKSTLLIEKETQYGRAQSAEGKLSFFEEEQKKFHQLQGEYILLQNQVTTVRVQLDAAMEKLATQKSEMEETGEKMRAEFRDLAQGILDEKTQKFTEVNEEKMKAILNPLKEQLGQFKQKVEETYDKESKERFSLSNEVKRLVETTQQIGLEANNLTTALKGNKKQQGNWGEMLLESILEHSGLNKNREYFLQEFIKDNAGNIIKDAEGKGLQPDVTIYYPDQRKVIIDSKVSLVAWDRYIAADKMEDQKPALKEHIASIYQHIDGLSKKNYPKYANALDYVIMFVPIEAAFLEGMKEDIGLWKYAYDKGILMVSPTNLLAVLKIVADLWQIEKQSRNAIAIAEKAGDLYDKFVGFVENMQLVGKRIDDAKGSYDKAFGQLSTGNNNIVRQIEQIKKMGASAKKQLGDDMLKNGEIEE